jgi:hypothetical protein
MKERILKILAAQGPMLTEQLAATLSTQSADASFRQMLASLVFARFINVWPSGGGESAEITRWGRNVAGRRKQ